MNKEYISKLSRALALILNDMPDNRDDTINEKLLDSLSATLGTDPEVTRFVQSFLEVRGLVELDA